MSQISVTSIGTNRYAAEGCQSIDMFNYNGCENLTLAQLVTAVCVRSAAYMERSGVVQMNMLTQGADEIETLSYYGEWVLDCMDTTDPDHAVNVSNWHNKWDGKRSTTADPTYDEIKQYLVDELGMEASSVVSGDMKDYHTRMAFYDQIESQLISRNSYVDRVAIELETCMTRRDSTYNIATTVVTHFGKSAMNTASAYASVRS